MACVAPGVKKSRKQQAAAIGQQFSESIGKGRKQQAANWENSGRGAKGRTPCAMGFAHDSDTAG